MQPCRMARLGSPRPTPTLVRVQGVGRKAQGVKVTNVLNEFRVSGTIERSFLIPYPRAPWRAEALA